MCCSVARWDPQVSLGNRGRSRWPVPGTRRSSYSACHSSQGDDQWQVEEVKGCPSHGAVILSLTSHLGGFPPLVSQSLSKFTWSNFYLFILLYYYYYYYILAMPCGLRDLSSLTGTNQCTLKWKSGVLISGPVGKSVLFLKAHFFSSRSLSGSLGQGPEEKTAQSTPPPQLLTQGLLSNVPAILIHGVCFFQLWLPPSRNHLCPQWVWSLNSKVQCISLSLWSLCRPWGHSWHPLQRRGQEWGLIVGVAETRPPAQCFFHQDLKKPGPPLLPEHQSLIHLPVSSVKFVSASSLWENKILVGLLSAFCPSYLQFLSLRWDRLVKLQCPLVTLATSMEMSLKHKRQNTHLGFDHSNGSRISAAYFFLLFSLHLCQKITLT